jgi:hypothetical protein
MSRPIPASLRTRSVLALLVLVAAAGCAMPRGQIMSATDAVRAPATDTAALTAPSTSATGSSASGSKKPAGTPAPVAPTTSSSAGCHQSCWTVGAVSYLPDGVAPEASGLAAAASRPDTWFTVDDGTHTDGIVAVSSTGALIARITIGGVDASNAEALAAGRCKPGGTARCLYLGDIGDNRARRADVVITRIAEPSLAAVRPGTEIDVDGNSWSYTYPDGPHDAEALVITPDASLMIITKSAPDDAGVVPPHSIYVGAPGGGRLTHVADFTPPSPTIPLQSLLTGTVVTDADYSNGRLLLLTYDEVLEYTAPSADADPTGFPAWPHRSLPHPAMVQTEGIAFALTGCGYAVLSEAGPDGKRSALATVGCR